MNHPPKKIMGTLLPILFYLLFIIHPASSSSFSILDQAPIRFIHCLHTYSRNATSISQTIFTPRNSSFTSIWQFSVNNIRFNTTTSLKPLVIVTPIDEAQIRTVLYCAQKQGIEVRIRCGGHDFEGLSYTNPTPIPFVMIDMINMRSIDIDVESKTAWVQGGASLGELYYWISQRIPTHGFPGGTWSTVGVGGLIGGGGYGFMMRKYGLAADYVVDARLMDVEGRILNRKSMGKDLFWAIRGGVASSFGVILAWKISFVRVPEKVTVFRVNKTLEENASSILHKWQYVAPKVDKNLSIRVQFSSRYVTGSSGKKTVVLTFEGLYLGKIASLVSLMDRKFPQLGLVREQCSEMSWIESVLVFTELSGESPEILLNRSAVVKLGVKGKSDFVVKPIPMKGLEGMWKMLFKNDGSEGFVLSPFGGRMNEISESAVPFPHRKGNMFMILERVFMDENTPPETVEKRIKWVRDMYDYLSPYVSKCPRRAFVNYNDLDLGVESRSYEEASIWGDSYFNKNFQKLVNVKTRIDPLNFFRHPQSIPALPKSILDV